MNSRVSRRGFLGGAVAALRRGLILRSSGRSLASNRQPASLGPTPRGDRPAPAGTLTWLSAEAFTGSWDPTQHMILANLHAEWNAFDRLFHVDPATGELVPRLALELQDSIPEGSGVHPAPGCQVPQRRAVHGRGREVHVRALHRSRRPRSRAYFPGPVKGKVIDDYTVQVLTDTPLPVLNVQALVHMLSHKDDAEKLKLGHNGTGPFKFVKYERRNRCTYEANSGLLVGPPRIKEAAS